MLDWLCRESSTRRPDVAETFRSYRALALAVTRCLPDGLDPVEVAETSVSEREQVVEEFLAWSEATGLAPDPANAGPAKASMQGLVLGEPPAPAPEAVLQVKIDATHAKPPIWRRLQIPATAPVADLHLIVQSAFGWQHAHLHQFEAAGRRIAPDDPSIQSLYAPTVEDERARGNAGGVARDR